MELKWIKRIQGNSKESGELKKINWNLSEFKIVQVNFIEIINCSEFKKIQRNEKNSEELKETQTNSSEIRRI